MIGIKDMDMPKSCLICDCCRTVCLNGSDREYMCGIYGHDIVGYYLEKNTNKRPKFCPLIEIEEESNSTDNSNRNWCLTCQSKEDCEGIDNYSMMTKEQCISGDYCLYCEEY